MPAIWSEQWRAPQEWLSLVEADLRKSGTRVIRGGDYDRWDLEISDGTFGSVRLRTAVEEHGAGKQLIRFRLAPRCSFWTVLVIAVPGLLSAAAAWDDAKAAAVILGIFPLVVAARILGDTGLAMSTVLHALRRLERYADERETPAEHTQEAHLPAPAVISLRRADN